MTELLKNHAGQDALCGLFLTGDCFLTDKKQKDTIKETFKDALCVEMESCAIAHVAFVNNIPFSALRCISDNADDNAEEVYATFKEKAAEKASSIVHNALKSYFQKV